MSEKAVEAASFGANDVNLPPKPSMEAEAPPRYMPKAQSGPEAGFQVKFFVFVVFRIDYFLFYFFIENITAWCVIKLYM